MIVPTSPNFVPGELATPSGLAKLNRWTTAVEQVLRNMDFVNNFKGKALKLTVQNGKSLRVPTQATFINVLKMVPNGAWENSIVTTSPAQGGFDITVTWTGPATSAVVDLFAGVA